LALGGNFVIEDRHAARDGAISLGRCTIVVAVKNVDE
jgi:hypothetical protein